MHRIIYNKLNNKFYSGAGLIILERGGTLDINKVRVILFRDSKYKTYMDLGGRIDSDICKQYTFDDILLKTACREALEESRHLLNINIKTLNKNIYTDIKKTDNTYYRAYFLCIDKGAINRLDYLHNYNVINNIINGDDCWKETDNLIKISIINIMNPHNKYNIFYRTQNIIKLSVNSNIIEKIITYKNKYNKTLLSINKYDRSFGYLNILSF